MGTLAAKNAFKIRLFGINKIWRSEDEIEADKIEQSLRDSIMSMVKKREDKVKAGETEDFGSDFLGCLMKANHELNPKTTISIDNIIDECKIFYIAGHETTSSLLSWTTVLLSVYPEWQEKARDEVLNKFLIVYAFLQLMMIVNETLRLYSPLVSITRTVDSKTRVGKYEIPKNAHLIMLPLALHRNPEIWGDDAHMFKPERFGDGAAKATNGNSTAFLPFGAGPRACVGLNFAANEAKIALAMILQRYKLKLSPNYVHAPYQYLLVNPQHGIQINLESL